MSGLGGFIREQRDQAQMSLRQLAKAADVSNPYLSQVERDNATPTLGTLAQVAQALGVGIDYFIVTPRPADAVTRAGKRMRFSNEPP